MHKTLTILLYPLALLVTWGKFLRAILRQCWSLTRTVGLCELTRFRAELYSGRLVTGFAVLREGVRNRMPKKCKGKKRGKMRR